MNWNWQKHLKLNSMKILAHMLIEYSALGAWYIALEQDPTFWIYGIITAVIIHLVVFTKIDFLHELHHHHKGIKQGHADHKEDEL